MRSTLKWALPVLAMTLLLAGWSFTTALAQSAKGKVVATVKTADGQPAANLPISLFKGDLPAFGGGGGRRGGGGGAGGGAPTTFPSPVATGTTDAKGVFTFEGVEAGHFTVSAGGGGGRGGRRGGGAGGAPPATQPGGAPAAGRGMGRGTATVDLKDGETKNVDITLMAGRGGGGGRRGGGGAARGGH